ncbi:hypothetical protein HDU83_006896 [Entophlyctis luteolus]|nr:hypothetical protein HDU83_006896 [Entophlyctis luteolus]
MQVGGRLDTSSPAATAADATSTHRHSHAHLHHSIQRTAAMSVTSAALLQKPLDPTSATAPPSAADATAADAAQLSDVVSDVSDSDPGMNAEPDADIDAGVRDDNTLTTNDSRHNHRNYKDVDDNDNREHDAVDDNEHADYNNSDENVDDEDEGGNKNRHDTSSHLRRRGRGRPARRVSMFGNVSGREDDARSADSLVLNDTKTTGSLPSSGVDEAAGTSSSKRGSFVNDIPGVDVNYRNNNITTTGNNHISKKTIDDDNTDDDDDLDEELDSEEGSDDNSDDGIDEFDEIKYSEIGPEDEILPTDDPETVSIKRAVREAKLEIRELKKAIEETAKQLFGLKSAELDFEEILIRSDFHPTLISQLRDIEKRHHRGSQMVLEKLERSRAAAIEVCLASAKMANDTFLVRSAKTNS